ncbi:hypothetical protein [Pseudanabaena sp. PCC 6802]|uniref:hypothetical protein n=1 Tax=Pseudanabaena sp. PCC 6802 TaxID=118173 RepID=UPI00034879DA|nr:hypothetical protein [Pseudanabaena sp. PCC 6802]
MATIKINELNPAGSNLFNDSESFMADLTDEQISSTRGGCLGGVVTITATPFSSSPVCGVVGGADLALSTVVVFTVIDSTKK